MGSPLSKKILVVDDDPVTRLFMEELLEDRPYEIQMVESGEEALEVAARFEPDLILLDVMMSGIDGYETCRRLREQEKFKYTKIMLVSAKAMLSHKDEGYEAGADDYISKPFDHTELLARVELLLRLKSVEQCEWVNTDFLQMINEQLRAGVLDATDSWAEADFATDLASQESVVRRDRYLQVLERLEEITGFGTGAAALDMKPVDLVALARSVVGELEGEARKKGLDIQVHGPQSAMTPGDAEKLAFVLRILLESAVKFSTDRAPIQVRIAKDGEFIDLAVSDGGTGIDADSLSRIFDGAPGERWKIDEQGAGMDLALSRAITECHGGTITVESASMQNCFRVRLRAAQS